MATDDTELGTDVAGTTGAAGATGAMGAAGAETGTGAGAAGTGTSLTRVSVAATVVSAGGDPEIIKNLDPLKFSSSNRCFREKRAHLY